MAMLRTAADIISTTLTLFVAVLVILAGQQLACGPRGPRPCQGFLLYLRLDNQGAHWAHLSQTPIGGPGCDVPISAGTYDDLSGRLYELPVPYLFDSEIEAAGQEEGR